MLCSKAEELLILGANPNELTADEDYTTSPIHVAAGVEQHSAQFTRLLLDFGADPNLV